MLKNSNFLNVLCFLLTQNKIIEKISNDQNQGMGMRGGGGMRMFSMNGDNIYKNTATHQLLKEQNMMGKEYVIKDEMDIQVKLATK